MSWLDRLLGRRDGSATERDQDEAALDELRDSFKSVRQRTDRIVDAYEQAEKLRVQRGRKP